MITADNSQHQLRKTLSPRLLKLINIISEQAAALDVKLYFVGGFVRDLIMGRPHLDLDFVVDGTRISKDAIDLVSMLVSAYGGKFQAHFPFHTATWVLSDTFRVECGLDQPPVLLSVDFASARTEYYEYPGALPTVELSDIQHDLKRRDFTVNAMAFQNDAFTLLDPFDGQGDIESGVIRVLHDQSFIDDPTRIFRAVRFEQRYGFKIERHTESLIVEALPYIDHLSGERVRHELDVIFNEDIPEKALTRLDQLGVLRAIDPNLRMTIDTENAFAEFRHLTASPQPFPFDKLNAYWSIFLEPIESIEPIIARLQMNNATKSDIENVKRIVAFERSAGDMQDSVYVRGIEPFSEEIEEVVFSIAHVQKLNVKRLALPVRWRKNFNTAIDGSKLIAMGLRSGPAMGRILRRLRDMWIDDEITSTDQERALVQSWIDNGTFN